MVGGIAGVTEIGVPAGSVTMLGPTAGPAAGIGVATGSVRAVRGFIVMSLGSEVFFSP